MKQVNALKAVWRDYNIVEIKEVCYGCNRPNCKPFRPIWGDNSQARFSYSLSYIIK